MTSPREDLEQLEQRIRPAGSLLVAFSGGVDSAVLLAAAVRALPHRVLAYTADSASLARRELALAVSLTKQLGVEHLVEATGELDNPEYARNDRSRCFFCKKTLFESAAAVARSRQLAGIAYGYTADDVGDFRPGHQAATAAGVIAPLADAGLGKDRIRAIAKYLGLSVWDKPAAPCLSSRIPYGSEVTEERLATIENVEGWLLDHGFSVCRARFDGSSMQIEVEKDRIAALEEQFEELTRFAATAGVGHLEIVRDGFRSGRLNQLETFGGSATAR